MAVSANSVVWALVAFGVAILVTAYYALDSSSASQVSNYDVMTIPSSTTSSVSTSATSWSALVATPRLRPSVRRTPPSPCEYSFPRPQPTSAHYNHFVRPLTEDPAINTAIAATSNTGIQLTQWLIAIYYALTWEFSFAYAPPLPNDAAWNRYFGLFAGEKGLAELSMDYDSALFQSNDELTGRDLPMLDREFTNLANKPAKPHLVTLKETNVNILTNANSSWVCHPVIVKVLRQKYCAARVYRPNKLNVYQKELMAAWQYGSTHNQNPIVTPIIVAVHCECPRHNCDADYISAMANVIITIDKTFNSHPHNQAKIVTATSRPLSFHLFTSASISEEEAHSYYDILQHSLITSSLSLTSKLSTHFALSPYSAFHHYVLADIFVSGNVFAPTLMSMLLRTGVSVIPLSASTVTVMPCQRTVAYEPKTGVLNTTTLLSVYHAHAKLKRLHFTTMDDCADLSI